MSEKPRVYGSDERSTLPIPSATDVVWVATRKRDPRTSIKVTTRFWVVDRESAAQKLGCEPGELDVVLEKESDTAHIAPGIVVIASPLNGKAV